MRHTHSLSSWLSVCLRWLTVCGWLAYRFVFLFSTCASSCDNCHSHVAVCLENVQYAGLKRWNMVMLCFWMFFCGRYVDATGFLKSWGPSLVLLGLVLAVHAAA